MLPEDMNVLVFKYVVNKDEAHNLCVEYRRIIQNNYE